jgi:hypothetical protein
MSERTPKLLLDDPLKKESGSSEESDDGDDYSARTFSARQACACGALLIGALVIAVAVGCFAQKKTPPEEISTVFDIVRSKDDPLPFDVLTAETRRSETSFVMPGAPGMNFTNIGVGKQWGGLISKMQMYLDAAKERAASNPDRLLIFVDGGDVAYGGCNKSELMSRYKKLIEAGTGVGNNNEVPRVVAGGDFKMWPVFEPQSPSPVANAIQDGERYFQFKARHDRILRAFNATRYQYTPYHTTAKGVQKPDYSFLNSGFIMGPAAVLIEVLTCMRNVTFFGGVVLNDKNESIGRSGFYQGWHWHKRYYDDQLAMTECMFNNPGKITIDYTGLLALAMNGVTTDVLQSKENKLINRPYDKVQCFIHFNGEKTEVERAALRKWGFGPYDDAYWNPQQNTSCPHGFCKPPVTDPARRV